MGIGAAVVCVDWLALWYAPTIMYPNKEDDRGRIYGTNGGEEECM
jgi:hypothetical protein